NESPHQPPSRASYNPQQNTPPTRAQTAPSLSQGRPSPPSANRHFRPWERAGVRGEPQTTAEDSSCLPPNKMLISCIERGSTVDGSASSLRATPLALLPLLYPGL